MDGWHLLRHVSERSLRRQGRPGAGLVVHKGGYGTVRPGDGPRARHRGPRRAQRAAGAHADQDGPRP